MALRKIALMHSYFGVMPDKHCRDCCHFERHRNRGKVYRKCRAYGLSSSEATDWAGKYVACGLFNKEHAGPGVVRLVVPEKRKLEFVQCDGQIGLED